jgi:hypothetical protein
MVVAGAKKRGLSNSVEFWALLETVRTVQAKNEHESSRRERNFYLWTRPLRGKSKRHDRYFTDAAKKQEAAQNLAKPAVAQSAQYTPLPKPGCKQIFTLQTLGRHPSLEYSESIPAISSACIEIEVITRTNKLAC